MWALGERCPWHLASSPSGTTHLSAALTQSLLPTVLLPHPVQGHGGAGNSVNLNLSELKEKVASKEKRREM